MSDLGNGKEQDKQKNTGKKYHPPGIQKQCPVGKSKHAAKGKFIRRQTKPQKTERRFQCHIGADGRNNNKHNGRNNVGNEVPAHNPEKRRPHMP